MVSYAELRSRWKHYLKFSKEELSGLIPAILITAFIFSFRDWGTDYFDLYYGLSRLVMMVVIVAISFFFRISCQKAYGLTEGHLAEFKVWWGGLVIALILSFVSYGRIPAILIGGVSIAMVVRHRLGEFRYGTSYGVNAFIGYWGILGNLILAILFAIGAYFYPSNYFFNKGMILNLIMPLCSLIPVPKMDGLMIYFGSRFFYALGFLLVGLAAVLLLSKTQVGLITAIVLAVIITIGYMSVSSEK